MTIIDLRSDTVTQPTEKMRKAMAEAVVGDDVLDEDPTIHKIQGMVADMMGKPAALFLPSGTMGNLTALLAHCGRGDEVILGDQSHIFLNEVGGMSAFGGLHPRILPNLEDGTISLETIERAIRPNDLHYPPTRLICLENTHNYCCGAVLTPEYCHEVSLLAKKHGLGIHLDGARIFNAATALGIEARVLAQDVDSVMFCLSKGLSAPVGSLLCGTEEFIGRARKVRKMAGGGMRQAGHLAAAGIVALEEQVQSLKADHDNARRLAQGLENIPGIDIDCKKIQTNIIFFKFNHPKLSDDNFLAELDSKGVKILMIDPGVFRAVLNRGVSGQMVDSALNIFRTICDGKL